MPTSPSSPRQDSKLKELREELGLLNTELFKLIEKRRDLVSEIQSQKAPKSPFASFDAERELQLFATLKQTLEKLSTQELLAFSLLMEGQAGAPEKYPAWSHGTHLLESSQRDEHRMNPLMLKILRPAIFETLKLAPSFSFLRSI